MDTEGDVSDQFHEHPAQAGFDAARGALIATLDGDLLKLAGTSPDTGPADALAGTVLAADSRGIRVACGEGTLLIRELQLAGRKRLPAADFLRGCALEPGMVLE